jgi:hypothetical protein
MLSEQWLNQRVGTAYAYWESRVPANELRAKCIERTLEMIRQYREDEDPEQYRAYVEARVDRVIQFAETWE